MSGISSEASSSIDYFSDARISDGHVQIFQLVKRLEGETVNANEPFMLNVGIIILALNANAMVRVVCSNGELQCHNNITGAVYANGWIESWVSVCQDVSPADVVSVNLSTMDAGDYEGWTVTDFNVIAPTVPVQPLPNQTPFDFMLPANNGLLASHQFYRYDNPIGGVMSGYANLIVYIDDMQ